ncbi:MAG: (d)CMP kinase [Candidatus Nanopelagicales bacterium]|nr:(d)CMP kinase [Candidatus Nanopelagicales bacterium]
MSASNSTRPHVVIAVDGPSGSGKSSISKAAAEQLNYKFLDTGAMYRALTWFCLQEKLSDEDEIFENLINHNFVLNISVDPRIDQVLVNESDITAVIRLDEVTTKVSFYAAMPKLRSYLVQRQQDLVENSDQGIVVEGRDIGSVVLPHADSKIYITANDEIRAKRRALQANADENKVLEAQKIRDNLDSNRKVSPLIVPEGAIILDNSTLNFEESVAAFIQIVRGA